MAEERTMHFDSSCPFLSCWETGPHDHPICGQCGAVRYGNLFCPECQRHHPEFPGVNSELAEVGE